MSLQSQTQGTSFKGVGTSHSAKNPSPEEWAILMFIAGFPSVQVVSEGLGVLDRETGGSFEADPGGDGAHFGGWQEDASFGPVADRLDPAKATKAAYNRWKSDGNSFHGAWGIWELQQGGVDGTSLSKKYKKIAENAAVRVATMSVGGNIGDSIPGVSNINEGIHTAENVISSTEDFLSEAFSYLTNFRKLGQLAAEAMAWFIRLLAKAIWDYVIAPLGHWSERAVSFYWVNYFSTGAEKGSGFGYRLRENAATITVLFWGIGYAVLWSDGTGTQMVSADESLMGQGIKGIEGAIARRNLVKPKDVKKKTPSKPKAKTSSIPIERQETYSVARKRPVSVTNQHGEGRTHNGRSRGSGQRPFKPSPVPRPGKKEPTGKPPVKKLVVAKGYSRRAQSPPPKKPAKTTKQSKPRVGA